MNARNSGLTRILDGLLASVLLLGVAIAIASKLHTCNPTRGTALAQSPLDGPKSDSIECLPTDSSRQILTISHPMRVAVDENTDVESARVRPSQNYLVRSHEWIMIHFGSSRAIRYVEGSNATNAIKSERSR